MNGGRWPVAPKAHGAWLGAGTGQAVAFAVITLIESFTRRQLDQGARDAIMLLAPMLFAFAGAYVMPHQARDDVPAALPAAPPEPASPPARGTGM